MSQPLKVVVLISGNGSNLQALIDKSAENNYQVVKVISNRPDVYGLERAANSQIPSEVVDYTLYNSREEFEEELSKSINSVENDLVVLAGFMRILTPSFTNKYLGKMLNIHPSLLPKYPGLNTHQRAVEAGDAEHGISIHFVTAELDGGPVILQASTPINSSESLDELIERIHQLEHQAYPLVVSLYAQNKITFKDNQALWNNQLLEQPLKLGEV